MTETIKLSWEDICRHEPKCECKVWMNVTVPDYRTYRNAFKWLRYERKYEVIYTEGVMYNDKHAGAYRFKFLCEQEYTLFLLKWS